MAFFFTVLKFMDLMYRIQKNSMNITCFSPPKIIFILVRLLHTLKKQLNFKYKMSFFLNKFAGNCWSLFNVLLCSQWKMHPKALWRAWVRFVRYGFYVLSWAVFMFKMTSFLSHHFKTLLYYSCQSIFTLRIISVI